MNAVIKAENLGKKYIIGHQKQRGGATLRDTMTHTARGIWQRIRHPLSPNRESVDLEELWALKDINFEVQQGERVGIIGRNGAGKSTLLKILSRITEPTTGKVRIKGRVSSLLEVGTGFHPELTGRENIFLNGAILGMTRQEVKRKFDEIIAFAELEKFLDTPVKRYSSGMYVRLAFAVAAHLEPEILIVDEVLAVGDAQFQKKCLGKMDEVAKGGRTVLFVSHNMVSIRNLCERIIWLQNGRIFQVGDTLEVTNAYLRQSLRSESLTDIAALIKSLPPDPAFRLEAVKIYQNDQPCDVVLNGRTVEVEIRYAVLQRTSGLRVYFDLLDDEQSILIRSLHDEHEDMIPITNPGQYVSTAEIPANLLAAKTYELRICAAIHNVRSCMGDGILIPLRIYSTRGINRAYGGEIMNSKLQPSISWKTKTLNTRGENI